MAVPPKDFSVALTWERKKKEEVTKEEGDLKEEENENLKSVLLYTELVNIVVSLTIAF